MKKILAILAAVIFVAAALAGCTKKADAPAAPSTETATETAEALPTETTEEPAKSADPLEMITDGYYTYAFSLPEYGDFVNFFHFYKEAPALGAVFYAGLTNNAVTFAGTYTVEKKEIAYKAYTGRDESEVEGTAPYTVTFYDFAGGEIGACGFDGEILYDDIPALVSMTTANNMYYHDTDADSKNAETYAAELGIKYLDLVAADDEASTLMLYHNQNYTDLVNTMIEGTWAISSGDAASGYTYALTPNDASDTAATLAVSADRMAAAYTPAGGEEREMVNAAANGPQVQFVFTGTQTLESIGGDADLTLSLYDDGAAVLEIDIYGTKAVIDQGAFTKVNDYTFGVTFETVGYIESAIDFETTIITLQYKGSIENVGDIDAILTLQAEGN
jgi:hypothetical protein